MDAPTERQFDVPVQQRKARDVTKSLDGARKWSSKITGLMIAGVGMLAYVTREGVGSGGDLSCTVLYSGLMHMHAAGRQLGRRLHVLLDNTAADNKNNEVIPICHCPLPTVHCMQMHGCACQFDKPCDRVGVPHR